MCVCIYMYMCSIQSTSVHHVSRYGISVSWLCKLFSTIWIEFVWWCDTFHASFVIGSSWITITSTVIGTTSAATAATTPTTICKWSIASASAFAYNASSARKSNMVSAAHGCYATQWSQVQLSHTLPNKQRKSRKINAHSTSEPSCDRFHRSISHQMFVFIHELAWLVFQFISKFQKQFRWDFHRPHLHLLFSIY